MSGKAKFRSLLDLDPRRLASNYNNAVIHHPTKETSASAFAEVQVRKIFEAINEHRSTGRLEAITFDVTSQQAPTDNSRRRIDFQVGGYRLDANKAYRPYVLCHVEVKPHNAGPSMRKEVKTQLYNACAQTVGDDKERLVFGMTFCGSWVQVYRMHGDAFHPITREIECRSSDGAMEILFACRGAFELRGLLPEGTTKGIQPTQSMWNAEASAFSHEKYPLPRTISQSKQLFDVYLDGAKFTVAGELLAEFARIEQTYEEFSLFNLLQAGESAFAIRNQKASTQYAKAKNMIRKDPVEARRMGRKVFLMAYGREADEDEVVGSEDETDKEDEDEVVGSQDENEDPSSDED